MRINDLQRSYPAGFWPGHRPVAEVAPVAATTRHDQSAGEPPPRVVEGELLRGHASVRHAAYVHDAIDSSVVRSQRVNDPLNIYMAVRTLDGRTASPPIVDLYA